MKYGFRYAEIALWRRRHASHGQAPRFGPPRRDVHGLLLARAERQRIADPWRRWYNNLDPGEYPRAR